MPQQTNELTSDSSLRDLRANFLATSTQAMPIAEMHFWAAVAVAALRLTPNQLSLLILFGSGAIFPLGVLVDKLTERRFSVANSANPVTQMFMQSLCLVALTWPLVILAARPAHDAVQSYRHLLRGSAGLPVQPAQAETATRNCVKLVIAS